MLPQEARVLPYRGKVFEWLLQPQQRKKPISKLPQNLWHYRLHKSLTAVSGSFKKKLQLQYTMIQHLVSINSWKDLTSYPQRAGFPRDLQPRGLKSQPSRCPSTLPLSIRACQLKDNTLSIICLFSSLPAQNSLPASHLTTHHDNNSELNQSPKKQCRYDVTYRCIREIGFKTGSFEE